MTSEWGMEILRTPGGERTSTIFSSNSTTIDIVRQIQIIFSNIVSKNVVFIFHRIDTDMKLLKEVSVF